MKKHIEQEKLLNFVDQQIPEDEAEMVVEHLVKCNKCTLEVEKTKNILGLMKSDDSADAPEGLLDWAKNIFPQPMAGEKKGGIRQILAIFAMDLSGNRLAINERGMQSTIRQMLYQAGENSLDLRVSTNGQKSSLIGQVLGTGFEKAKVELLRDRAAIRTETNDLSEFSISKITPGSYDLKIQKGDLEILLRNLDLI